MVAVAAPADGAAKLSARAPAPPAARHCRRLSAEYDLLCVMVFLRFLLFCRCGGMIAPFFMFAFMFVCVRFPDCWPVCCLVWCLVCCLVCCFDWAGVIAFLGIRET